MSLSTETLKEIRILAMFNPESTLEGIKVHHTAAADDLEATQRLFDKGLVTLPDGGYLTSLGQEAVRHLATVVNILA
jgi:uncharacterized protein (TIGR02647 family)